MTDWNEASDDVTAPTWSEHTTIVPVAGHQPVVGGDEWDGLWTADYDFTPYARASRDTTPQVAGDGWTENT
jgi:hypothetical protein